jgi:hypothetical protein
MSIKQTWLEQLSPYKKVIKENKNDNADINKKYKKWIKHILNKYIIENESPFDGIKDIIENWENKKHLIKESKNEWNINAEIVNEKTIKNNPKQTLQELIRDNPHIKTLPNCNDSDIQFLLDLNYKKGLK